jgi:hypothetical protein
MIEYGTTRNMWFAVTNIQNKEVLVNFAKFTHTQIKVGLLYCHISSVVFVCISNETYNMKDKGS